MEFYVIKQKLTKTKQRMRRNGRKEGREGERKKKQRMKGRKKKLSKFKYFQPDDSVGLLEMETYLREVFEKMTELKRQRLKVLADLRAQDDVISAKMELLPYQQILGVPSEDQLADFKRRIDKYRVKMVILFGLNIYRCFFFFLSFSLLSNVIECHYCYMSRDFNFFRSTTGCN